jgi:dUTP pyrophosphatase
VTTGSPICYLAHPIDFQAGLAPNNVDHVRQQLVEAGFVVYRPSRAFSSTPNAVPNPALQQINEQALVRCDALVAMYPEDKTIGVPMELQRAIDLGKPVLVISRADASSWVLAAVGDGENARVVHYPGKNANFEWLRSRVDVLRLVRPDVQIPLDMVAEPGHLPSRAYLGDAGFDLYTVGDHAVEPGEFVDIPVGCSVELPQGVWALLTGRSSTLRTHELLVNTGIIDTGYRGPLFAGVRNLGSKLFAVKHGMRLAQLIPLPNLADQLAPREVQRLADSPRGTAGFGSSGA